jgi:hypothetical protein
MVLRNYDIKIKRLISVLPVFFTYIRARFKFTKVFPPTANVIFLCVRRSGKVISSLFVTQNVTDWRFARKKKATIAVIIAPKTAPIMGAKGPI